MSFYPRSTSSTTYNFGIWPCYFWANKGGYDDGDDAYNDHDVPLALPRVDELSHLLENMVKCSSVPLWSLLLCPFYFYCTYTLRKPDFINKNKLTLQPHTHRRGRISPMLDTVTVRGLYRSWVAVSQQMITMLALSLRRYEHCVDVSAENWLS